MTEDLARAANCNDLVAPVPELTDYDEEFLSPDALIFIESHEANLPSLHLAETAEWSGTMTSGQYSFIWSKHPETFADEIRKILQSKYAEAVRIGRQSK